MSEQTRLGTTFPAWDLDNWCWEMQNTVYLTRTGNLGQPRKIKRNGLEIDASTVEYDNAF